MGTDRICGLLWYLRTGMNSGRRPSLIRPAACVKTFCEKGFIYEYSSTPAAA